MNTIPKNVVFWVVLIVIGAVIWNLSTRLGPSENTVAFSQFMNWVDAGQVAKVTITGNEIRGTTKANPGGTATFLTYSPGYGNLIPRLLEKGVQIDVVAEGASRPWTTLLSTWLPMLALAWAFPAAILIVAIAMLRRMRSIDEKLSRLLSNSGGSAGR